MVQSRRGSTYSKNAVVEIFGLLWEETDYQHGLTIPQIRQRLIERHAEASDPGYQAPSERTIREQLKWLSNPVNTVLGRPIHKVDADECAREGITDYTPGWYMSAYLTIAEMRLLIDSLMLSRINDDMLDELSEKIAHIAGGHNLLPRKLGHIEAFGHYNTDFLHTIEGLDRAIEQGWCVDFEYCDYDVEGNLIPRRYDDGTVRHYALDPYRTIYKTGKYYVIGHIRGSTGLIAFITDRIRNLRVLEHVAQEIELEQWQEDGTLRPASDTTPEALQQMDILRRSHRNGVSTERFGVLDPVRFMRERPYMTTGEAVPVTMVIRANMLTNLYEWFDKPRILDTREDNYLVQVMSPELAMLWWTAQYSDSRSIYIIEPRSLRNKLYDVGRFLTESYGTATGPSHQEMSDSAAVLTKRLPRSS